MGPKSENVGVSLVLALLFEGSRAAGGRQDGKESAERYRLGGGRGRVNPPPRSLVLRFWRLGGFETTECIYMRRGQRPRRILSVGMFTCLFLFPAAVSILR